jgi:hypothetical protein
MAIADRNNEAPIVGSIGRRRKPFVSGLSR